MFLYEYVTSIKIIWGSVKRVLPVFLITKYYLAFFFTEGKKRTPAGLSGRIFVSE